MKHKEEEFPTQTVSKIILTNSELQEVKKESPLLKVKLEEVGDRKADNTTYASNFKSLYALEEIQKRYSFSMYLIDPNMLSYKIVLRILAIVIKFVNLIQHLARSRKDNTHITRTYQDGKKRAVILTDKEINKAEQYFFKKGSLEVKQFVKQSKYKNITEDINGILTFTGRILPTDEVQIITPMTSAMKDLHSTMFCVPVLDKYSPISYAIINEVHWNSKAVQHRGVESIWRYTLKTAYIIEGREVVKWINSSCQRCRYLKKKSISVSMGKISDCNITIAPAFYFTQIDLAGPFKSFSNHHKRTTVKIWLTIFVCATTSVTSIKVMEDYSAHAFIQAFIRFACEVGYPKKLLIDGGSQLIKGCNNVKLNFHDLQYKLHNDVSVKFEICPIGGHNMNGKVERKIREINSSFDRTLINHRLSILQW